MERIAWDELCRRDEFRGRWVALDDCAYDEATGHTVAGAVVDVDDNLDVLCRRVADSEHRHCAILFCRGDAGW